jgi:hypothetical protein
MRAVAFFGFGIVDRFCVFVLFGAADAGFALRFVPADRFLAAPIAAPERAPITVPTTGTPKAVPATAPAAAPPRVLLAVPFRISAASSSFFFSSMFLPLSSEERRSALRAYLSTISNRSINRFPRFRLFERVDCFRGSHSVEPGHQQSWLATPPPSWLALVGERHRREVYLPPAPERLPSSRSARQLIACISPFEAFSRSFLAISRSCWWSSPAALIHRKRANAMKRSRRIRLSPT